MIMKKIIALALAFALCMTMFAGCGGTEKTSSAEAPAASGSDVEYIKNKGELVVGITIFEPFDYQDDQKNWVGFDAEFAKAAADKLGVKVKFQVIDWDNKVFELDAKSVDCLWNAMTITDKLQKSLDTTDAYMNNSQVVVMKADKLDSYKDADSMKSLKFAAEAGSAGESAGKDAGFDVTAVTAQTDALTEVKSGSVDACIIDETMAKAMTGKGTGYEDLGYQLVLTEEQYGVGCRKGSDLVAVINELRKDMLKDGSLQKLAEKYDQSKTLITE